MLCYSTFMPENTGAEKGPKLPELAKKPFEVRLEDPDSIFGRLTGKPGVRFSLGLVEFKDGRPKRSYIEVGAVKEKKDGIWLGGSINLDREVDFNEEAMVSGLVAAVLCAEGKGIRKGRGTQFFFETEKGTKIQIGDVQAGDTLGDWIMTFNLRGGNSRDNFDSSMKDLVRLVGLAINGVSMTTGHKPASNEMVLKASPEKVEV